MDVSKFLRYACGPSAVSPGWERLTDRDQLVGYMEKLKRSSIGPECQLAKLDGLCCALRFLRVEVLNPNTNQELTEKATHMQGVLHGWKTTLRKGKRKLQKKRLEDLSNQDLSLEKINQMVDNESLWREFDSVCYQVRRGETLSTSVLNDVTILLAASILFKNWQRPGAVCNTTLEEFRHAKLVPRERDSPLYLLSVKDHKTALEGYAKLVLNTTDHARVLQYKATVRKFQDVDSSPLLFVMCGGQCLTKLSNCIQRFGERRGLLLPTAMKVRQIGSTEVAMHLGDTTDAHLITRHIAHSAATESRYYQAIVGDCHSLCAYNSMEGLRERACSDGGSVTDTAESTVTPKRPLSSCSNPGTEPPTTPKMVCLTPTSL